LEGRFFAKYNYTSEIRIALGHQNSREAIYIDSIAYQQAVKTVILALYNIDMFYTSLHCCSTFREDGQNFPVGRSETA
jgi:hypothetical protein